MILFIDKEMAREGGMTHSGSVYGIPCWIGDVDNPEAFSAVTKFYPINFLVPMLDALYDGMAMMTSKVFQTDVEWDTPITVGEKI